MDLRLFAVQGLPMVAPGDDVAELITDAIARQGEQLQRGDVVVVAQKIISKSEGRYVNLADVTVSDEAQQLAEETDKDPRAVQVVLDESAAIVRKRPGVLIVEHRQGWVHANAGIDRSNIDAEAEGEPVLLLPEDVEASCDALRGRFRELGHDVAVIINDSTGRAWRIGTTGMALACSGIDAYHDQRGATDLFGNELKVTMSATVDEMAAAASLVQGEATEGTPVVVLRGYPAQDTGIRASALLRPADEDMFR